MNQQNGSTIQESFAMEIGGKELANKSPCVIVILKKIFPK
jgi:hypothetical protein